jgi:hypothetical protein
MSSGRDHFLLYQQHCVKESLHRCFAVAPASWMWPAGRRLAYLPCLTTPAPASRSLLTLEKSRACTRDGPSGGEAGAGAEPVQGFLAGLSPRFRQRGCEDAAAGPITSDRHNLGLSSRPDGAMAGRGILWWMGPGITAKLMSVRVKRRIRLILGAAYPWKGRADFGVKSPSRRPNGTKCLNGWSRLNRPHRVKSPCGLGCAKPRRHTPSRD